MATKNISELTLADALTGDEVLPIVQSGTTKKATPDQLAAVIGTAITASETAAEAAATSAASSASAASVAATTATTKATEASASAQAASDSADAAAATVGSLAASTGSSLVGFLQSGTGAVARTIQDKARDHVSILDFIPVAEHAAIRAGTSTYDCSADLQEAINSFSVGTSWYVSGPSIYFPPGDYHFDSTIELKKRVRLYGDGSGMPSGEQARFIFPVDTKGIIVHRYNTTGSTTEGTPTTAADGSIIEGISVVGVVGSDTTAHGIWLRARATLRGVQVSKFTGNGINIVATAGGAASIEGNANNWRIDTARIIQCGGNGVYVDGADVNAGVGILIDCSSNGRSGIYDSSFLGNTWIACHTANNGLASIGANTATQSSFVTYGGNRYAAYPDATEQQLVDTVPGTDALVWALSGAGGVHPQVPLWVAGSPLGTYFHAYGYWTDNANSRSVFVGCYSESGAAGNVIFGPSMVLGGPFGTLIKGDYLRMTVPTNRFAVNSIEADSGNHKVTLNEVSSDAVLSWQHDSDPATGTWRLQRSGNDYVLRNGNLGTRTTFTITGENTAFQFGTGAAVPFAFNTDAFYLGAGANARRQSTGAAAPVTGTWARGSIVWNIIPSAGGVLGWVCTATGTPGTWVPFGGIRSANAYTVTNPATDRALDVAADTTAQVAAVLGTLIADLKSSGILQ